MFTVFDQDHNPVITIIYGSIAQGFNDSIVDFFRLNDLVVQTRGETDEGLTFSPEGLAPHLYNHMFDHLRRSGWPERPKLTSPTNKNSGLIAIVNEAEAAAYGLDWQGIVAAGEKIKGSNSYNQTARRYLQELREAVHFRSFVNNAMEATMARPQIAEQAAGASIRPRI